MISCEKQVKLFDLYSEKMFDSKFDHSHHTGFTQKVSCFKCINNTKDKCNVKTDEPIYTGYLGDPKSDVLIIGEAPSLSAINKTTGEIKIPDSGIVEYVNAHINEDTEHMRKYDVDDKKENNGNKSRSKPECLTEYVKNNYGNRTWPYFTDLIKCRGE